jgi:hypothetical protein
MVLLDFCNSALILSFASDGSTPSTRLRTGIPHCISLASLARLSIQDPIGKSPPQIIVPSGKTAYIV